MNPTVIIDKRFCGPPTSGNGGYTCGSLAGFIGNPAEVMLLSPPPLETPLTVKSEDGSFALCDKEKVVARGVPFFGSIEAPPAPSVEAVEKGGRLDGVFEKHAFPSCFVCGPDRRERDGLRIFPSRIEGAEYVASMWTPDSSLIDDDGLVRNEIIWAALDCPGAWAAFSDRVRVIVLGKMAVNITKRMRADEPCIVLGWKASEEGRKIIVGTALYSAAGDLFASSKATWVELK